MAEKQFDYSGLLQFAPSVLGAGAAYLGASPMRQEAERLRKERERLLAQGAPGLTPIEQEQLAAARSRAATSRVPGYAQEAEGIAQQQADVLAAGKRGSQTSSNLLNLLSKLNAQGQAARRNLAMRGAQAQQQAQRELGSTAMGADARRMQRQQLFERQLAAMDAAARQYKAQSGMAPLQGAISMMPSQGYDFDKLFKEKSPAGAAATPSPYKSFAEIPSQFSEKEPMYNPYAGQNAAMMRMAPQAADMGPGATPPPMNLKRMPSMMAVPQEAASEEEFVSNPQAFNPIMNTTMRRTYRPSRLPNTMSIESPIRTPYQRF
jgi:hypothetical protein